ncbi:MAG: SDR family NAD(P)-dependent oxidoreductase [Planctomycetota bacterium]|jgi:3-oxoacyl-[acyl-carrier protein] reductase
MEKCLEGKVALVTGSTKGLGYQTALTLGKAGAKVAMNYFRDEKTAEKTFAAFNEAGCEGILVRADVSNQNDVNNLVQKIEKKLGSVDILVVNATPDIPEKPIENYTLQDYHAMIDFFIISPFLLTQAVISKMKEKQWGRIINIGSEVLEDNRGNFSAYTAAKGGQKGWTKSMATELASYGITVNIISPGWIPVERHRNEPQEKMDAYLETVPAGRWGVPQDVADAVLYFSREEASFVSGQTLCVNGGRTPW